MHQRDPVSLLLLNRQKGESSRNWLLAPPSGVGLQIQPSRDGTNAPITMQHEQANIQVYQQIFSIVVRMAIYGWVES
jgi:hypothetical protein